MQGNGIYLGPVYRYVCTDTCVPLPVQVFPAHGAGSPCGKNLSTALYSTIGKELATNPALQFSQDQVGH